MKRLLVLISVVTLTLTAGLAAYGYNRVGSYLGEPIDPGGGFKLVEVPKGAGFKTIVARLHAAEVVTDPLVFEWYGRYRKLGRRIKAGTYRIDLSTTPRALLTQLDEGSLPAQVRITIKEGWNRWQIAEHLAQAGLVDEAVFLARVERDQLEGRLFPDTYWIKQGATVDDVVRVLTSRFDEIFEEVLRGHPEEQTWRTDPAARAKLVNLASLVEKEARTDRDRKLVSRVFANRIAKRMKLQTDPTCVYGKDIWREVPHPRFCKDPDNRYSTYIIPGLPPTPIGNPGRAALDAAARPAKGAGSDKLLYFVARRDGSGEHHFSATYDQHRAAVKRFLVDRR